MARTWTRRPWSVSRKSFEARRLRAGSCRRRRLRPRRPWRAAPRSRRRSRRAGHCRRCRRRVSGGPVTARSRCGRSRSTARVLERTGRGDVDVKPAGQPGSGIDEGEDARRPCPAVIRASSAGFSRLVSSVPRSRRSIPSPSACSSSRVTRPSWRRTRAAPPYSGARGALGVEARLRSERPPGDPLAVGLGQGQVALRGQSAADSRGKLERRQERSGPRDPRPRAPGRPGTGRRRLGLEPRGSIGRARRRCRRGRRRTTRTESRGESSSGTSFRRSGRGSASPKRSGRDPRGSPSPRLEGQEARDLGRALPDGFERFERHAVAGRAHLKMSSSRRQSRRGRRPCRRRDPPARRRTRRARARGPGGRRVLGTFCPQITASSSDAVPPPETACRRGAREGKLPVTRPSIGYSRSR